MLHRIFSFLKKLFLLQALFLGASFSVLNAHSLVDILAQDPEKTVVETFFDFRAQYPVKVVCKFLARQKPHDILACFVELTERLDARPKTMDKPFWDNLLSNLEEYAYFLDRVRVLSDDVSVLEIIKKTDKTPDGVTPFYDWWKRTDPDSFCKWGGLYFDYHLIGMRAPILSAWDMNDPLILSGDLSVQKSLRALEHCVAKFEGLPKFQRYYERAAKRAAEFVVAMRNRINQKKYQNGPVIFAAGKSIPRTPAALGLVGNDGKNTSQGSFCESFLSSYGICPDERYGHEYHEYLLNQTADSYDKLEKAIEESGIKLDGRIMVMGYEGSAFERYFTNFNDLLGDTLCDEASFKGNAGWSPPPANYFGYLTAFALRDANFISKSSLFEHIHDASVELFPRVFELLQKDSFTQLFGAVRTHEDSARNAMEEGDVKGVLGGFVKFFDFLYEKNVTFSDNKSAATQDILFNRKHVQRLIRSAVPTLKFYTGPDITYPILPTKQRNSFATNHAQAFARKFVQHLVPRDGEPTVYIFNSFVDGVGKSTMLGNIKNWIKHGDNMDNYEVTDNTSSQLADIFEFSEGVYIADLPAQISHFTYKPDGYVFVDVASVKGEKDTASRVVDYFIENEEELITSYRDRIERVQKIIAQDGWHALELNQPSNPFDAFSKNLCLLKKVQVNPWIPCEFEGKFYLVNAINYSEVRSFMSLSEAQSSGLKNVQADQMFFFDGITLPLAYQTFLDDLTSRCLEKGVKRACFVDFLSMYMRSARENIRLNYLMQQMAMLFSDFDQKDTVYRDFTGNAELLSYLEQPGWYSRLKKNLERETLVRWSFNALLEEWKSKTLSKISLKESTPRVRALLEGLSPDFRTTVKNAVATKLGLSTKYLHATCGLTKEFINMQSISWNEILSFAKKLEGVMSKRIADKTLKTLWSNFGGEIAEDLDGVVPGECNRVAETTDGKLVRVRYVIDPEERNSVVLKPVFRILRAVWYNSIFQLIESRSRSDGQLKLSRPIPVLPWSISRGVNGLMYVVQPNIPIVEDEVSIDLAEELISKQSPIVAFVKVAETQWAKFGDKYFTVDIKEMDTSFCEYAFGCYDSKAIPPRASIIFTTRIVENYVRKNGPDTVMFMADAAEAMTEKMRFSGDSYFAEVKRLLDVGNKKNVAAQKGEQDNLSDKDSLRYIDANEYLGVELFMGLAVKLEQVMHDPEATLVVRRNNKADIKGALQFLEQIVLPQYFGIVSQKNLASSKKIWSFLGLSVPVTL